MATTTTTTTARGFRAALDAGHRKLVLAFGGQGSAYWDELTALYAQGGAVRDVIDQAADALHAESSSQRAKDSPAFERVLELKSWLRAAVRTSTHTNDDDRAEAVPTIRWDRAGFSYPLIALAQAANYVAFLAAAGVRHEHVLEHAQCAVGVSQGVVIAAVAAAAATDSEFVELAVRFVRYLFWHGLRAQEAFLATHTSGDATPMLAVNGLPQALVTQAIADVCARTECDDLQLSLVHAPEVVCVTGRPSSLALLRQALSTELAPPGEIQTRVPFSQRKPTGELTFVAVSCPFHSPLLASARAPILDDAARVGVALTGAALRLPVYATTRDAANLQALGDADILALLVEMQLTELADWSATLATARSAHSDATHVLDFGPDASVSRLIGSSLEGFGIDVVAVVAARKTVRLVAPTIALPRFLADATLVSPSAKSWVSKFAPRVNSRGELVNKFTRALKRPPVIVAGMNPTTSASGVDLVAAIMNAGYFAELAGGGLFRLETFETAINGVVAKADVPGLGLALNMVYFNIKQWAFQFPMVLRLRKSGVPIESITIGAGIPTMDRAVEIMAELLAVGIRVIGFKPGSLDAIYAVLDIARANPLMTVTLQWTGGRAGGHHSFEDFHRPLAVAYAAIRRVDNVVLVAGSGFGNWEDSVEYLTGEWSRSRGLAPVAMPVDAILLGSRVMVAKEAATADEVKALLVATPGIASEVEWERSYTGSAGGIVTVVSEHGELVHKVENRCTLLWREFDAKYFSKSRDEMERAVRRDRDWIIERINADFQKPFFGVKSDVHTGLVRSAALEDMTYSEVLARMVELMYVVAGARPKRWLHADYQSRVAHFMARVEQRFQRHQDAAAFDQSGLATEPHATLARFVAAFPRATTTLVAVADCDYFLDICRTGGKPVNFIPIIDGDLRTWFKKDSLWYSEDLDGVPDRDAQRVCILQGPVAVRYSTCANEPVASILHGIADGFTQVVAASGAIETATPGLVAVVKPAEVAGFPVVERDGGVRFAVPADAKELPTTEEWLAGMFSVVAATDWLATLLSSRFVVEDKRWVANPIRELLRPQRGQALELSAHGLNVFDASTHSSAPAVEIFKRDADGVVVVKLNEERPATARLSKDTVSFEVHFAHRPETTCPIQVVSRTAVLDSIKRYFAKFLVADGANEEASCIAACDASVFSTFTDEFTVSADDLRAYRKSLRLSLDHSAAAAVDVPADFAFVAAWKAVIKPLLSREVAGSMLRVVHRKYSCKLLTSAKQIFAPGDTVASTAVVTGVRIVSSGKVVSSVLRLSRAARSGEAEASASSDALVPLLEIHNDFLLRGRFDDYASTFSAVDSVERVELRQAAHVELLQSAPWLTLLPSALPLAVGDALKFQLSTKKRFGAMDRVESIAVAGSVFRSVGGELERIGDVAIDSTELSDSPVDALVRRLQQSPVPAPSVAAFASGGYNVFEEPIELRVPEHALEYAVASRDLNPIHRSVYAAILADLPDGKPLMQGMWTAGRTRALIAEHFGAGVDAHIATYEVSFDGIVYPGDKLFVQVRHVGQDGGNKALVAEVVNERGDRVVTARASVKEPPTAFVFTGQGSVRVGLGMDRYEQSSVARAVWNRGDAHLRDRFGFSILDIVRTNPKSLRIHFGGKRGRAYRANFMALTCDDAARGESVPLFPDITARTQSYTFSSPDGLLFLTQFSQPALVLYEKAAFAELAAARLIPDDVYFAGHSLGEYAALSTFADAPEVEDVVELVFLRGLIMQRAVVRDAAGRSDYAMVAADPSRVGLFFTADALHNTVARIAQVSNKLLQVVNFNVRDQQYVVAGEVVTLEALAISLSKFKALKSTAALASVVDDALSQATAKRDASARAGEPFALANGVATVPLPGIDVPFHSRELLGGVPSFRSLLRTKYSASALERKLPVLLGRYIPNLVGRPFSLERSYVEDVYAATKSPYLAEVLCPECWETVSRAELVHLLIVELLAYQFASPVQWIDTQAVLFSATGAHVRRVVEIGPAPTLTNMARRTLQRTEFSGVSRELLWYERDRDTVHFAQTNAHPSASEHARALLDAAAAAKAPVVEDTPAPVAALVPVVVQRPEAPAAAVVSAPIAVEDARVSALHVLRVLLATRLHKPLAEIAPETTVKVLCAGKSAVQNEVLGDVEKEFGGSASDSAGDVPLAELASSFASYATLGKVSTGLVAKMVAAKMPGGFTMTSAKMYLRDAKALGPGRIESVLVHSLLSAPPARLKSDLDAHRWLDASAASYAAFAGISLTAPVPQQQQSASPGVAQMPFAPAPVALPTVVDAPVDAKHALRVLLAVKTGKPLREITDATTIKELSAGKSALQNEIFGDLEGEFGGVPDDSADLKLQDVASKFRAYASPGKVTSALVGKMVASSMPGGFGMSALKQHLARERCLPAGRIDSVLLHSLTHSPKQRLADASQARAWLDAATDDYAALSGLEIPYASKLGSFGSGHQSASTASQPTQLDSRAIAAFVALGHKANDRDALSDDAMEWRARVDAEVALREESEASLARWVSEHGANYANGVAPAFDARKERQYDSFWNWAMQDTVELFYRLARPSEGDAHRPVSAAAVEQAESDEVPDSASVSASVDSVIKSLRNRATPEVLQCVQYLLQRAVEEGYDAAALAMRRLEGEIKEWVSEDPVAMPAFVSTQPQVTILPTGQIEYSEVPRVGVESAVDYVDELARGLEYSQVVQSLHHAECGDAYSGASSETSLVEAASGTDDEPDADLDDEGFHHVPLQRSESTQARSLRTQSLVTQAARTSALCREVQARLEQIALPHVHIRKSPDVDPTLRLFDVESTCVLLACMHEMASTGVSFAGKVALVTGCGKNSIGAEVVKTLLEGGATVFVTTSSFSMATAAAFRATYEQHGSRGSRLVLLPCNLTSKHDVEQLVAHIYTQHRLDLDFVVPFAALSEIGSTIVNLDGSSELAHRLMLTNVLRLLGAVADAKRAQRITSRPALVVLPMSTNRGSFGGDGLYVESKLGFAGLLDKWYSEDWAEQLSIVGAVIGWTRSTGLMTSNDDAARGFEDKLGVRTFSTVEMAFNVSALLHPDVVDLAADVPVWADLTGGVNGVRHLKQNVDAIRAETMKRAKVQQAMHEAIESEKRLVRLPRGGEPKAPRKSTARANLSGYLCDNYPSLDAARQLAETPSQQLLRGLLDLRKVVVIAGFGEVGPWGSARTRWEMESFGEFSLEGCIELAWLTGRIVFENGHWVDATTKEVVAEHDVKAKYEEDILKHAGIRIIEPELFDGYDPHKKIMQHQVAIDTSMAPIEVADRDEALQIKRAIGDESVDVYQNREGGWMVRLRKGSVISIPRALSFDRFVAGQIPTGWSAERLGVPKDIAESVDAVTLYTLMSTMEAFVAAGVTDPYEFYQYVHVSAVGNTSGGAVGGLRAWKSVFQGRSQGKSAPSDILQECFINTTPAWVNMLLLSSSGPIKTPVGACATAAESIDIGVETIKSGKARVVVVGGFDDFGEEGSYEFAQMKTTSDSVKETAMGREPKEMCRPCTPTRGGFMESHGAGTQLLMDAELALEMGCPIYGVVALTSTATDKNGRSVPAPGQGILTTAREAADALGDDECPLLDLAFRRRQFDAEVGDIEAWFGREMAFARSENRLQQVRYLERMKLRKVQAAQAVWGHAFFEGCEDIAPLRGALSVWNLSVDDIGVASFHGTGTKGNDWNESDVTQKQLEHLGRSAGNALPVICQKHLTGHTKGAAAALMINGLVQVLHSGLIPGNTNLDNTCGTLREFDLLVYPNRSIQTTGIKAAVMKSFGFGQAGGEVLLVHPDLLLSTLEDAVFGRYAALRAKRMVRMNAYMQSAFMGKHTFIQVKDTAPYTRAQESSVYLDPTARAAFDIDASTWRFTGTGGKAAPRPAKSARVTRSSTVARSAAESVPSARSSELLAAAQQTTVTVAGAASSAGIVGLGVDVEPIATFEHLDGRDDFIRRNFTAQEVAYCNSAAHAAASFAGRWAAKEAVVKAISSASPDEPSVWKGAGAPLRDIEVVMTASGAPAAVLSGYAREVFDRLGLAALSVSISHTSEFAVAQAIASVQPLSSSE